MLTEREQLIVDWLRRGCGWEKTVNWRLLAQAADAIEAGEHLKRPEPTIPVSEWIDKPSVGYGEKG